MNPNERSGTGEPAASVLGQLGVLLLDAGFSVTDVRVALHRAAQSSGIVDLSYSVFPDLVIVSNARSGAGTVVLPRVAELTFRQAARANLLTQKLESGDVLLGDIPEHIAWIREMPRSHASLYWTLGSALVGGGLAVLFRCPWWAILSSIVVGASVGLVTTHLNRRSATASIVPFVGAFASTTVVGVLAELFGFGHVPLYAVCAPVAILVPGALITNALLELTAQDVVTGSARLSFGPIQLGFMIAGIAAGASITGLALDPGSAALVGQVARVSTTNPGGKRFRHSGSRGSVLRSSRPGGAFVRLGAPTDTRQCRRHDLHLRRPHNADAFHREHFRDWGDSGGALHRRQRIRAVFTRRSRACVLPTSVPAACSWNSGTRRVDDVRYRRALERAKDVRKSVHRHQGWCDARRDRLAVSGKEQVIVYRTRHRGRSAGGCRVARARGGWLSFGRVGSRPDGAARPRARAKAPSTTLSGAYRSTTPTRRQHDYGSALDLGTRCWPASSVVAHPNRRHGSTGTAPRSCAECPRPAAPGASADYVPYGSSAADGVVGAPVRPTIGRAG